MLIVAINIIACSKENEVNNRQTSQIAETSTSAPKSKLSYKKVTDIVNNQLSKNTKKEMLKNKKPRIKEITVKTDKGILKHVKYSIAGKMFYKVTYATKNDSVLGPIVYLVDEYNGETVGEYYRE